jgi:hypothetical protein
MVTPRRLRRPTLLVRAVDGFLGTHSGYSWVEIGFRLGITRQAAQQSWG